MTLRSVVIDSPLGRLKLTAEDDAITSVTRTDAAVKNTDDTLLRHAAAELKDYFAGRRQDFTVPLRPTGTAFQSKVWRALTEIPYGHTATYGEVAARVGTRSARAVGQAVGANPICIVIPCHRVLAGNGIGGFGWGLPAKRRLLEVEGIEA